MQLVRACVVPTSDDECRITTNPPAVSLSWRCAQSSYAMVEKEWIAMVQQGEGSQRIRNIYDCLVLSSTPILSTIRATDWSWSSRELHVSNEASAATCHVHGLVPGTWRFDVLDVCFVRTTSDVEMQGSVDPNELIGWSIGTQFTGWPTLNDGPGHRVESDLQTILETWRELELSIK